jgi:ribonuclease P protein component
MKSNSLQDGPEKKKDRITRPQDFSHILKNGQIHKGRYLTIASLPWQLTRVGFTTEKGLKAVERNKLKRWLRELWHCHARTGDLNRQVVVQIRRRALSDSFGEVKKEFEHLMNNL